MRLTSQVIQLKKLAAPLIHSANASLRSSRHYFKHWGYQVELLSAILECILQVQLPIFKVKTTRFVSAAKGIKLILSLEKLAIGVRRCPGRKHGRRQWFSNLLVWEKFLENLRKIMIRLVLWHSDKKPVCYQALQLMLMVSDSDLRSRLRDIQSVSGAVQQAMTIQNRTAWGSGV